MVGTVVVTVVGTVVFTVVGTVIGAVVHAVVTRTVVTVTPISPHRGTYPITPGYPVHPPPLPAPVLTCR